MSGGRFVRFTPREYQQTVADQVRFPFQEMYALAKENQNRQDAVNQDLDSLSGLAVKHGFRTRDLAGDVNKELSDKISAVTDQFANNPNDIRSARQQIAGIRNWLMNDERAKLASFDASLVGNVNKNIGDDKYGRSTTYGSLRDNEGNWNQINAESIPSSYDERSLYDLKVNPGDKHMVDIFNDAKPYLEQHDISIATDAQGNQYLKKGESERLSNEEFNKVIVPYLQGVREFSNISPEAAQYADFNKALNSDYGMPDYIEDVRRKFGIRTYERDASTYSKVGDSGSNGSKSDTPPVTFTGEHEGSHVIYGQSEVTDIQPLNRQIAESDNPEKVLKDQLVAMGVDDNFWQDFTNRFSTDFYKDAAANTAFTDELAMKFYEKKKSSLGQKVKIDSNGQKVYQYEDQSLKDQAYTDAVNASAYVKTYMDARRFAMNDSGLSQYYNDKTHQIEIPEDVKKSIRETTSDIKQEMVWTPYGQVLRGVKKSPSEIEQEVNEKAAHKLSGGKYKSILDARLKKAFDSKSIVGQSVELSLNKDQKDPYWNPHHEAFAESAKNKVFAGQPIIVNGISYGDKERQDSDIITDMPLAQTVKDKSGKALKTADFTNSDFKATRMEWDGVNNKVYAVGYLEKDAKDDEGFNQKLRSSVVRVDMTDEMMGEGSPLLTPNEQTNLLLTDAVQDQMNGMIDGESRQLVPGFYTNRKAEEQKHFRETLPVGLEIQKVGGGYRFRGDLYNVSGNDVQKLIPEDRIYSEKELLSAIPKILEHQSRALELTKQIEGQPVDMIEFETEFPKQPYVNETANKIGVTPDEIKAYTKAIWSKESSNGQKNVKAKNSNALGVYQMMPETIASVANALGENNPTMKQFIDDIDMQNRYGVKLMEVNYDTLMKNPNFARLSKADKLATLAYAHHSGVSAANRFFGLINGNNDPKMSNSVTGVTVDKNNTNSLDYYYMMKKIFP